MKDIVNVSLVTMSELTESFATLKAAHQALLDRGNFNVICVLCTRTSILGPVMSAAVDIEQRGEIIISVMC